MRRKRSSQRTVHHHYYYGGRRRTRFAIVRIFVASVVLFLAYKSASHLLFGASSHLSIY